MVTKTYVVRVELRDSENADYDELHNLMEQHGFSRTFPVHGNPDLMLPSAEYVHRSSDPVSVVARQAEDIASEIKEDPKIMAIQSEAIYFLNLDEV